MQCLESHMFSIYTRIHSKYPNVLTLYFGIAVFAVVPTPSVASEAYHDWSGEAAGARLRVNFTLKLLLSQNFRNRPLMRFISFASNIGPAAAVPAGLAPAPLTLIFRHWLFHVSSQCVISKSTFRTTIRYHIWDDVQV